MYRVIKLAEKIKSKYKGKCDSVFCQKKFPKTDFRIELKKLYSTGKFGQFAFKLSVYQIELSRAQYYRLIRLVFNFQC